MTKFCPSCGEKLVDGAKFCKNRGRRLDDVQVNLDEDYRTTPPAVENDHTLAFIVGIIADIIIPIIGIIIGIYIYTRKDSSKAKKRGISVIALGILVWIASAFISFFFMGY